MHSSRGDRCTENAITIRMQLRPGSQRHNGCGDISSCRLVDLVLTAGEKRNVFTNYILFPQVHALPLSIDVLQPAGMIFQPQNVNSNRSHRFLLRRDLYFYVRIAIQTISGCCPDDNLTVSSSPTRAIRFHPPVFLPV
jgi:hypothetical protein